MTSLGGVEVYITIVKTKAQSQSAYRIQYPRSNIKEMVAVADNRELDLGIGASKQIIDIPATGRNIAELRKKAGLSVSELQSKMELASPQAIYRWQRGETIPTIDNLAILADVLGITIDEIIVRKTSMNDKNAE